MPAKASARRNKGRSNTKKINATTDADIARQIAGDADTAPELTDAQFASARFVLPPKKVAVAIRLDPAVLEYFRAQGPGYQSRINAALMSFVKHARKSAKQVRISG